MSIYYEERTRHLVGMAQGASAPPEMRFILLRTARQFMIRARALKLKAASALSPYLGYNRRGSGSAMIA